MLESNLIKIISDNYSMIVTKIEKSDESTVGNVYFLYTKEEKYVLKIYDDLDHTKSMTQLHNDLSNNFNIPKVIKTNKNNYYVSYNNSKHIVLYSFLEGEQVGKIFNKIDKEIIEKIAIELRKIHNYTLNENKYNLNEVSLVKEINLKRKSLLHFDLTKGNIFYNETLDKIGFIDFDDAKYGYSVYDVAILILLLFFSKKRGIDDEGIKIFIDAYYGEDLSLKLSETKYIKEIALNWIDLTLSNNDFNPSTTESFKVKKDLINDYKFEDEISLIPLKYCIDKELYDMYQDIPKKEIGSMNKINGVSYEKFLKICKEYINEENNVNKKLNTKTIRYIMCVNNIPIGEAGIRLSDDEYWKNKGSQIFYKIRLTERKKGYGNLILELTLKKAKELGFKKIRINCDNKNIASKKTIFNNGGKKDIENYKTLEGYSTSYIIDLNIK